jgi:hypothetical protein
LRHVNKRPRLVRVGFGLWASPFSAEKIKCGVIFRHLPIPTLRFGTLRSKVVIRKTEQPNRKANISLHASSQKINHKTLTQKTQPFPFFTIIIPTFLPA